MSFRELQAAAFYAGPLGSGMERELVYLPRSGGPRTLLAVVEAGAGEADTERGADIVESMTIAIGRDEAHASGGVDQVSWGDAWRTTGGERWYSLVEVVEETPTRWRLRGEHRRSRTVQKRA